MTGLGAGIFRTGAGTYIGCWGTGYTGRGGEGILITPGLDGGGG